MLNQETDSVPLLLELTAIAYLTKSLPVEVVCFCKSVPIVPIKVILANLGLKEVENDLSDCLNIVDRCNCCVVALVFEFSTIHYGGKQYIQMFTA